MTLKGFRESSFKVLVATIVAACGLKVPEVDLVLLSSPPQDADACIHSSGHTGRAGWTGIRIRFYQLRGRGQLRYVEQKAGITFKHADVPSTVDLVKFKSRDAIRSLASVSYAALVFPDHQLRGWQKTKGSGCIRCSISQHFWSIELWTTLSGHLW